MRISFKTLVVILSLLVGFLAGAHVGWWYREDIETCFYAKGVYAVVNSMVPPYRAGPIFPAEYLKGDVDACERLGEKI